jgi:hypothetical protein
MAKKLISLFTAMMFLGVLMAESQTQHRENNDRGVKIEEASTEPATGFMEAEKENDILKPPAKFPWLIIAGVAVAAFLILMVLKKKDCDIRGTWELTLILDGKAPLVERIAFSGTKTDGDYHTSTQGYGDYNVEEKKVRFGHFTHGTGWNYGGVFIDPKNMEGTYTFASAWSQSSGTWAAKKISSASELE